ncbi:hypothetical protein [Tropicimonas isoalkanivorans]|uniref:Uncharacterized protein n=1 Tax=Tropicimonas isoalkanivorans TaxID=441112 RepID=A0A1I1QDS1_9RHOB|nr:hypothetical protein [Tropicimonas isoalkanivorans]SFD20241.1 hypothetical protein SAMN04488094_12014 [Tropicimonas isoalkanivorans]
MSDRDPLHRSIPPNAAPEFYYPGLSPQLLARVKQLWSAQALDFDRHWHHAIRELSSFCAVPRVDIAATSAEVDLVFLFDQCLIWTRALHSAARLGLDHTVEGLTADQWHGLAALSARLTEQLSALRLLALNDLPMPAMQIARSISEDVDMALVLLMRPKLARRFAECRDVEEASDFWRRHIAGGRAYRTISETLYSVGVDHSADTDYAKWRKQVLTILGAAVHSNALSVDVPERRVGAVLLNDDSLHFATFRLHELCAYSLLVKPDLPEVLQGAVASAAGKPGTSGQLAELAGPLSSILISQIASLATPASPVEPHRTAAHV